MEMKNETKDIKFDLPLVNGFFEDIGHKLKSDSYKISDLTYKYYETRLIKPYNDFLKLIGLPLDGTEQAVQPLEYTFDPQQLNNIIVICDQYYFVIKHLLEADYIGEYRRNLILAQKEYQMLKTYLEKGKNFNRLTKENRIDIWLGARESLSIESNALIEIIVNLLSNMEEGITHIPQVSKWAQDVFHIDPLLQKELGRGKKPIDAINHEIEMYTWKLYQFLNVRKVIRLDNGKNPKPATYHYCIADLYTLMGLPDMTHKGEATSWDYLSEKYDKTHQIKRIARWIELYQKKI